ncbi:maltose alpha-D-glucosyltransferase [Bordetella genomosp. 13]|uniref:maltose alpha-D-glucosyltransferase n=1 Tax=Bordetella genomosp. 13 TaxID=463040 RepID=A0A1W6Z9R0_9BORD|nr:maltose alpha-D-glucosyltransferase [Bordetella genomosp. 13]ARP94136.1 maltose alpha-D-glucosyltransferase [Bordetella genomosp. 13]
MTTRKTAKPAAKPHEAPEDLWYKDAIIYQLHVKSFFDADNNGIGDFQGLIDKLDYIAELGVTAVWLLPFYPSPRRDDGYDIAEYRGVHPDYGSLSDVRRFIRAAHARGLRVITELVVNHTSDQHAWFQRARTARPGSAARKFYVWSDDDKAYSGTRIIFLDTEKSNWTWDPVAGAYYWHRFYSHQPDLNYDNPQVLKEVLSVMRFWLDMGVDGLRLDAVPYLVEREGTNNENLPETHAVLKQIRSVIQAEYPGRMLLAEANQWPEDAKEYFGDGDECHMSFHFPLMPRMYMAIAQEDRFPITDIIRQTPDIPANCQWAIFLRNHDELTLEMVTSEERDYLWNIYAADSRARINLGIRRRLAPLLERDRRRVELMNSLLLSMPGTPVLYYGDELGMGDNIHLGDRDGVRTPMQWSSDRNGGFSRADPERLTLPLLMGPLYGYESVNVEAQQRDPHSLLNWTRRMLATRRQTHAFGRGTLRFLFPGNRKILAYLRLWEDTSILCVANLSNTAQPLELSLPEYVGRTPLEMLGNTPFPVITDQPYRLTLPPYAFFWMDLRQDVSPPSWQTLPPEHAPTEYPTLVLRGKGLAFTEPSRRVLETEILPAYLARQRWSSLQTPKAVVRLTHAQPVATDSDLYLAEVSHEGGKSYLLPLGIYWTAEHTPQQALAKVRRVAQMGTLCDAMYEPAFVHRLIALLRAGETLPLDGGAHGALEFLPEEGLDLPDDAELKWVKAEQSNSSVVVGGQAVLKLLRAVQTAATPEAEMTRHLTRSGYANTPPLLGEIRRTGSGEPQTIALMHGYILNEGDAWGWSLEFLKRALDNATLSGDDPDEFEQSLSGYATIACTIGKRLGELHAVLAREDAPPEFRPAKAGAANVRRAGEEAVAELDRALEALKQAQAELEPGSRACVQWLSEHRDRIAAMLRRLAEAETGLLRLRIHGDFHLGQVLIAQTDAYIIDFEGEPAAAPEDRHGRASPYRDVAGMLRSFDYAAATVSRADPLASTPTDVIAGATDADGHATAARERREALLERFRHRAGQAFLNGYRDATAFMQVPAGIEHDLLRLAQIQKAAYEVRYEVLHRPSWISIPLCALAELSRSALLDAAIDEEKKP